MGVTIEAQLDDNNKFVNCVNKTCEIAFTRMSNIWLYPDFIFYRTKLGEEFKSDVDYMNNFTNEV